jgi:branched-chain amino acid transport system substrate-binding protein
MKRVLGLFVVAVLLVAACGSDSDGGGAAQTCTVRLGAATSETGSFSREGLWNKRGYEMWLDWVNNERGGIRVGDQVCKAEIIFYDDESDPDTSARLYEKLIIEDQVNFLLGPYSSGITMSASAIAEQHGVIMVEAHGASESLFTRGFTNLFAVLTPASYYTESALEALADAGAQTAFIANRDETFSIAAADGAEQWVRENGMQLLGRETYPPDSDLTAIMTRARDLNPDVFVGSGHFNDSVLFVRMAQELGFVPKAMMLTVGPDSPEFVAELGAGANFVMGDSQWDRTMGYEDEFFGSAADFAQRYYDLYGEWPPYQVASSAAAALALYLAIEDAGSLAMDAVRTALQNLDVDTFYGPINFDETGKNTAKPMVTVQVLDGAAKVVAPADVATTELVYPVPTGG